MGEGLIALDINSSVTFRLLGDTLAQSARRQGAHGLHSHGPGRARPLQGSVGGLAQAGSRDLGEPVERFAKPLVHLDLPTSMTQVSVNTLSTQKTWLIGLKLITACTSSSFKRAMAAWVDMPDD